MIHTSSGMENLLFLNLFEMSRGGFQSTPALIQYPMKTKTLISNNMPPNFIYFLCYCLINEN